jgi:hypothetical protein
MIFNSRLKKRRRSEYITDMVWNEFLFKLTLDTKLFGREKVGLVNHLVKKEKQARQHSSIEMIIVNELLTKRKQFISIPQK